MHQHQNELESSIDDQVNSSLKKDSETEKNKIAEAKAGSYEAKNIVVLGAVEAIRLRPGMYIGSTDKNGVAHLFIEVINNSIDEHLGGHGNKITISLSDDSRTITVSDQGRGIPFESNQQTGKNTLETVFTSLHSGAKFDNATYQISGGLHGVGVTAVNALSSSLTVESRRDRKIAIQQFERGVPKSFQILNSEDQQITGTLVRFSPDEKIFANFEGFDLDVIRQRAKELAYLNPSLTIDILFTGKDAQLSSESYHFPLGLRTWIQEMNEGEHLEGTEVFQGSWQRDERKTGIASNNQFFEILIAFQYNNSHRSQTRSFCNNVITGGGGKHVDGYESALLKIWREKITELYPSFKISITKDDVTEGLSSVVSVKIPNPQFVGQTKEKLSNQEVRELASKAVYELIEKYLKDNKASAEIIAGKIVEAAIIRSKQQDVLHLLKENKVNISLPGKLSDCLSQNTDENELFIVEGKSAKSNEARDVKIQATIDLQGKIPNAEKFEKKKILGNEEFKDLINAMGFSTNEVFQNTWKIEKLRYGKVIIMTDADADGAHISLLLVTFFFKFFREIIENKRLFIDTPPLYRLQSINKDPLYFFNDRELQEYREKNPMRTSDVVQRFKGLGEMNPSQLRETTMDSSRRVLHQLSFSSLEEAKEQIERLMGIESAPRKLLLESGEHRGASLIVSEQNSVEVSQFALVNFLLYSHMVVEGRAIPHIDDGLKPVQRRIIYTLYELNILPNKRFKKSAKVVGEVMGKYHPHGDSSIYQAIVNMVQPFSFRYPLVDGQGNWGSLDGSPAAAYRYTEARLAKYGLDVIGDLDFETVDWVPNYDETEKEPSVLPTTLPNLLLNGSSGVAVGMSTNIPPHNIKELIDLSIALLRDPSLSDEQLLQFVFGPDFPTGGIIINGGELANIYQKGEGTIYVRSRVTIEENFIRITEIPFKINKVDIVKEIDLLIKKKKIEGVKSIVDYSNLEGVNIVIRIEKDREAAIILNQLYKRTSLQSSFSVKLRAIKDGRPKLFSLREIINNFLEQRMLTISKRSQFLSKKIKKDLEHASVQIFIAKNYQEIAKIVRESVNEQERDQRFKEKFSLSRERIDQILDTPSSFRQFSSERVSKLEERISNLNSEEERLQRITSDRVVRTDLLIEELSSLRDKYANEVRRTEVLHGSRFVAEKQLVSKKDRLIILNISQETKIDSSTGQETRRLHSYLNVCDASYLVGTNPPSVGREINKSSKGAENRKIIRANSHDDLWCFSNFGKLYVIPIYMLPVQQGKRFGTNIREDGILKLAENEIITNFVAVEDNFLANTDKKYLTVLTKKGKIKRVDLQKLNNVFISGKKVVNILKYDDQISQTAFTTGNDQLVIFSKHGRYKYINESLVRVSGRGSYGINGIKLRDSLTDQATGLLVFDRNVDKEQFIVLGITEDNIARKLSLTKLRQALRCGGFGQQAYKTTFKTLKEKNKQYCDKHQAKLNEHKTLTCCDKEKGVVAYLTCPNFKAIQQEIRKCSQCRSRYTFSNNFLLHTSLVNLSEEKYCIYVLAGKFASFYDKNEFLYSSKTKKRSFFRTKDNNLQITDLFVSSKFTDLPLDSGVEQDLELEEGEE